MPDITHRVPPRYHTQSPPPPPSHDPGRRCQSSRLEGVCHKQVRIRFDCRLLCRGRITNWVPYPTCVNRSPRPSRIGPRKSMPKTPEIDYFCPCRRGKISPTAWWNVHPPVGEERAITNEPYRPYLMLCSKLAQDTHTHTLVVVSSGAWVRTPPSPFIFDTIGDGCSLSPRSTAELIQPKVGSAGNRTRDLCDADRGRGCPNQLDHHALPLS